MENDQIFIEIVSSNMAHVCAHGIESSGDKMNSTCLYTWYRKFWSLHNE